MNLDRTDTTPCFESGKDMKITISIRQTVSGHFRTECVAMPGCVAIGLTFEKACQNMKREIACYIASMDGVCPEHLDLTVASSSRSGEVPEPEQLVEVPVQATLGPKAELIHQKSS